MLKVHLTIVVGRFDEIGRRVMPRSRRSFSNNLCTWRCTSVDSWATSSRTILSFRRRWWALKASNDPCIPYPSGQADTCAWGFGPLSFKHHAQNPARQVVTEHVSAKQPSKSTNTFRQRGHRRLRVFSTMSIRSISALRRSRSCGQMTWDETRVYL